MSSHSEDWKDVPKSKIDIPPKERDNKLVFWTGCYIYLYPTEEKLMKHFYYVMESFEGRVGAKELRRRLNKTWTEETGKYYHDSKFNKAWALALACKMVRIYEIKRKRYFTLNTRRKNVSTTK